MDIDQTWDAPGHNFGNILIAGAKPHPTNAIEQQFSLEVGLHPQKKKKEK